jgi:hypothetical protein
VINETAFQKKKKLCHDTSDSESVPKNGQARVQLRAHALAAFAS